MQQRPNYIQTTVRQHLDSADTIYYKLGNIKFKLKIEIVQCNASLAITGASKGTTTDSIHAKLDLESQRTRGWYWKTNFFLRNSTRPFSSLPNSLHKIYR